MFVPLKCPSTDIECCYIHRFLETFPHPPSPPPPSLSLSVTHVHLHGHTTKHWGGGVKRSVVSIDLPTDIYDLR